MNFAQRHGPVRVALLTFVLAAGAESTAAQEPVPTPRPASDSTVAGAAIADSTAIARDKAQSLNAVRISAERTRSAYAPVATRSALKTVTPARDVPQSLSLVTRQLVRDQSMQGMADVVRYVPGITMGQGEGHRDAPTLRGNATTADFFVDGVRDDVQYLRDLYNMERLEALKGSNAMAFGRGGGGGAINRVTKEPEWSSRRELNIEGGSHYKRRISADIDQQLSPSLGGRVNAMLENSNLYRDGVTLERSGVNPTLTLASSNRRTRLTAGLEHFRDRRTADRGVPSFGGRPLLTDPSTFFGDPDASYARAIVNSGQATLTREGRRFTLRNHARVADYDKFYQNVFPGAVNASGSQVSISAYNHDTQRSNLFNQTDLIWTARTGGFAHQLLAGAELGRQTTENFRQTGYFDGTASSLLVPVSAPRPTAPVTYRQGPSDPDNATTAETRSVYVQDQVAVTGALSVIAGIRYERFDVRFRDHRSDDRFAQVDDMVSPRLGVVVKPARLVSLYGSYSLSWLPGSGDQFSTLTNITAELRPERFTNYEVGAKWDVLDRLALTAAAYRLDRTNTRAVHPTDPAIAVQTGTQRSKGVELGISGSVTSGWEVVGGFARQDAKITSASVVGPAGATVPLVPATSASLWNRVTLSPRWAVGLGAIHQTEIYAAIDNRVRLPAFTRVDAGLFARLADGLRAQLNVENLLDTRYYSTAHNNNNITPGSPRAARFSLSAEF